MNFKDYVTRLEAIMTADRVRDYGPLRLYVPLPDSAPLGLPALREAYEIACAELKAAGDAFDYHDQEPTYLGHYRHTAHFDLAHYMSDLARWVYDVRCLLRAVAPADFAEVMPHTK